jgi:hypothetical protein
MQKHAFVQLKEDMANAYKEHDHHHQTDSASQMLNAASTNSTAQPKETPLTVLV